MTDIPVKALSEIEVKSEVSENDKILILDSETEEARLASKDELKGDKGDQWEKGDTWNTWPQWPKGDKWDKWDKGDTWNTWEKGDKWDTWNTWPQWEKGDKWDKWDTWTAATITVWSTTTWWAWTSASVVNSGTSSAAVLDFTIPKWDKGDTWNTGATWNWIASVTSSKSWKITTVTITETDGDSSSFEISDGADWQWAWDVVWPSSSTDGGVVLFDWTTWKLIKDSWKTLPSVIDNLTSSSTADALSANQWKVLKWMIDDLMAQGKFLSLWDSATWQPISFPLSTPYTYNTWDYFMVETVDSTTNYKPNWSSYSWTASSTTESWEVAKWDYYVYDWTIWLLATNHGKTVSFSNLAGNPEDNQALDNALDAKQDSLTLPATPTQWHLVTWWADNKTLADGGAVPTTPSKATSSALWTIKLWSDTVQSTSAEAVSWTANRTYAIQLNSSDQAVVNVPWENTTYSNLAAASWWADVSLVTTGDKYNWDNKQSALVSWTNIKTINSTSLLGSGNISVLTAETVVSGDSGTTYTIKKSTTAPTSATNTTITFVV